MKIQKGQVKYKDRDDIIVTYGTTDDGRSYYFLDENDEKKFLNGNRIASTVLKEAIDPMVEASHMGIVDEEGREVIPFTHRAIRPITEEVLLVMLATPISPSVIEVEKIRKDALAASQLLNRSNEIKKKLTDRMGSEGRFIFNNLFSEATICDIYGNNLVNGEYFSFIGISDGKLFLSKNTVESDITEFPLYTPVENQNVVEDVPVQETVPASGELNVSEVEVPQEVVESALNGVQEVTPEVANENVAVENVDSTVSENLENTNGFDVSSVTEDLNTVQTVETPQQIVSDVVEEAIAETADVPVPEEMPSALETAPTVDVETNAEVPQQNVSDMVEETIVETPDVPVPEEIPSALENAPTVDVEANVEVPQEVSSDVVDKMSSVDEFTFSSESKPLHEYFEETPIDQEAQPVSYEDVMTMVQEPVPNVSFEEVSDTSVPIEESIPVQFEEDDNLELSGETESTSLDSMVETMNQEDKIEDDLFKDSMIHIDSISNDNTEDYSLDEENETNMVDIADSLENLIHKYNDQRSMIRDYEVQLEKANEVKRSLNRDLKSQEQKLNVLTDRLKSLESSLARLESKNESLETKVREQEELIERQANELNVLKPQLKGKDKLVRIYSEAKAILEEDSYKNKYNSNDLFGFAE